MPDCEVLLALRQAGLTQQQIATRYGTSSQAVSEMLRKCGEAPSRVKRSHTEWLPWPVLTEHKWQPPHRDLYRRLIELHTLMEGWPQREGGRTLAEGFRRVLEGDNPFRTRVVVDYTPEEGFTLVRAQEGDGPVFSRAHARNET